MESSAWNNARTWEEKDVTEQVKEDLKLSLKGLAFNHTSGPVSIHLFVHKVTQVSGDVQLVLVSGKKGSLYDLNVELKWKGTFKATVEKEISGKLKFPEVANGIKEHSFESECTFSSLRQEDMTKGEKEVLMKTLQSFEDKIREAIFHIVDSKYSS